MAVQLVTALTHRVNALNLVPYHLMEHETHQWYGTCHGSVSTEYPWLRHAPGTIELMTLEQFNVGIRHVDWKANVSLLQQVVDQAAQHSQNLFFGSHSPEQIAFLKEFFGPDSLVIGLTYQEHNYEYLLEDLARTHLCLLQTNKIQPNEHDQEVAQVLNQTQLIKHYKTVFDQSAYIPRSCGFQGDYEIPFDDYTDVAKMEKHFENIKLPVIDRSRSLYHTWYNLHCQEAV
jgi:hypothetical protein